jgi:cholesterol transport system auxiliary component
MPVTPRRPLFAFWLVAAGRLVAASATLALSACAVTQAPATKAVYDFGPAPLALAVPAVSTPAFPGLLALAEVGASPALDNTAVQYRLAYANPQELRPYALARWSMSPARLIQQRVRRVLSARGPVLAPGDGSPAHTLRLELEEFSQVFSAPGASQGVMLLRATLLRGNTLLAQRSFGAQPPAPTADASGGVSALAVAADAVAKQLADWVGEHTR